jgi:Anti-sigma-28 factor, FlgM
MTDMRTMRISELKQRVASADYRVDEREVAGAILRRPSACRLLLIDLSRLRSGVVDRSPSAQARRLGHP